ncbi:hypothetical protein QI041_02905 [Staphylococcus saprophyticus]|nr:hypothetical protein [Staphylococcus saprophyticus]MDW4363277.1 hypothetical protein [Staphylococcus saprophyticus]MDW4380469.1 hypothetical protein [Staphylococcus saprophyticus]
MTFGIDLWKIVLESNCSEETERDIKIGLDDLYAKSKAFDEIKEFIIEKDLEIIKLKQRIKELESEDKQND